MRHTPELHFVYDDSVDRGERIDTLLRQIGESEELDDEGDGRGDNGQDGGERDARDPGSASGA